MLLSVQTIEKEKPKPWSFLTFMHITLFKNKFPTACHIGVENPTLSNPCNNQQLSAKLKVKMQN